MAIKTKKTKQKQLKCILNGVEVMEAFTNGHGDRGLARKSL